MERGTKNGKTKFDYPEIGYFSYVMNVFLLTRLRTFVILLLLLQPDREDELMRIEGEGGRVINWNGARVFGVLAMSRAIGFLSSLFLLFLNLLCSNSQSFCLQFGH